MNLLEEIARAMCSSEGGNWDALTFNETLNGETPEEMREGYIDAARSLLPIIEKAVQAGLDASYRVTIQSTSQLGGVRAIRALSASEIVKEMCGE